MTGLRSARNDKKMTKIANIAKNTSYLTIALIMQKVISFTYFAILARNLGPESLGKYYFAISFTTIFAIFIDLGFINFLTREVAKRQDEAQKLIGNILSLKLVLTMVTVVLVLVTTNLFNADPLTRSLVYVSIISMVLDSFTTTFFAVMRGFHNLKYESISSVIFQLVVLISGLLAMYFKMNLVIIIGSLALASIYNFVFALIVLQKKLKIKLEFLFDPKLVITIFQVSWPFALYAIYQRVYMYLDSVLLSTLAGDYYVGLYQVAFKIIFALQFLPLAFTASLYPAMSNYWLHNRPQLVVAFERSINYLIIISLPIVFVTIMLADKIVLVFKKGYDDSILPLQITIASLVFLFVNFSIGSLLNACDRQRKNTRNMLVVMIVSVSLNLLLIPYFKAVGASITVLITNALMFILGIVLVKEIIPYRPRKNIIVFLKVLLASMVMGVLIYLIKQRVHIIITLALAGIAYFVLLFGLGAFKKADLAYIIKSFKKSKNEPITDEPLSPENA
jgi:O-antigen/teichoic acid export membrane protein